MENRRILTKTLATLGTVLVWIPLLFTVVTSVIERIYPTSFGGFRTILMPAELFPIAFWCPLALWRPQRAHSKQKTYWLGFGAAVVFLIAVTSCYSQRTFRGTIEPTGWAWALASLRSSLFTYAIEIV